MDTEVKITSIRQGSYFKNHRSTHLAHVVISFEDNDMKIVKNRYGQLPDNHFDLDELFQNLSLPLCQL
jgi:hypothetical protein